MLLFGPHLASLAAADQTTPDPFSPSCQPRTERFHLFKRALYGKRSLAFNKHSIRIVILDDGVAPIPSTSDVQVQHPQEKDNKET